MLYSWSESPDRPDLAAEWDGRKLSGHAAKLWAQHATDKWDLFGQVEEVGDEFRADNGFANNRPGDGWRATLTADLQPTNHLAFGFSAARRVLDVDVIENGAHLSGRLFTADLGRLRAVYTFNARTWLRVIGEWQRVERDPALYIFDVRPTSGDFGGSAVFAYELNWQTVLFLGVGDERTQDPDGKLQPLGRQAFFKISYALQR